MFSPRDEWVTNSRFPFSDFRYFNSPFEVLFNFPSRYLFAIDLSSVFSRGWRLPPILRSTPKERDSLCQYRTCYCSSINRAITVYGMSFLTSYLESCTGADKMHNSSANWIHILGCSHFVRHYSENPCWFLFLRLIICLNSAGILAWARIVCLINLSLPTAPYSTTTGAGKQLTRSHMLTDGCLKALID